LVVEQILHWGYFYYYERVESVGNRIKHGQWVYWGKFGVKRRQGQFENGKKTGLW
jgi:ribulose bisphosphate carboxylase small subunit